MPYRTHSEYHQQRAAQELECAARAKDQAARMIHLELAKCHASKAEPEKRSN